LLSERAKALEATRDRILVPVANPRTAHGLARLAFVLAEASEDTSICVLTVVPKDTARPAEVTERLLAQLNLRRRVIMQRITEEARLKNAPLYSKVRAAPGVSQGILDEVSGNVKLVLMGWPGPLTAQQLADNPVKLVLQKAHAHVAVLLNRGLDNVQRILVPVGGGFHSRLAIRLAYEIALPQHAEITAIQILCETCDTEELEDRMLHLREIIEDSLGQMPAQIATRLVHADDILSGVLQEATRLPYDLIVVGASDQWLSRTQLFGSLTDEIAEKTTCSVLLVRRHEAAAMSWIRRQSRILPAMGSATNGKPPHAAS
jgi:nucleotide-binding universal stress UspA family protein